MKYLKTYNQLSEGLRDKMVGKSEEEILNSIENLSGQEKIKPILVHNLPFSYLPRNDDGLCIHNGELLLSFHNITKLPEDFVVNGDLRCLSCNLTELPKNLTVNGNLNVASNFLTELPSNLYVFGDFYCQYNKITKLPEDLIVTGELDVRSNPLDGFKEKFGYLIPVEFKKPEGVKYIKYE